MTTQKIIDIILEKMKTNENKYYYTDDRANLTIQTFTDNGAILSPCTYGGYRFKLLINDTDLIAIIPNRANRDNSCIDIKLTTSHNTDNFSVCGYEMKVPYAGGEKYMYSLMGVLLAWNMAKGDLSKYYLAIGQSGHCAICGATLTDELSMSRGIGPECFTHIGIGNDAVKRVQGYRIANN